jgi:hypothetical protein
MLNLDNALQKRTHNHRLAWCQDVLMVKQRRGSVLAIKSTAAEHLWAEPHIRLSGLRTACACHRRCLCNNIIAYCHCDNTAIKGGSKTGAR